MYLSYGNLNFRERERDFFIHKVSMLQDIQTSKYIKYQFFFNLSEKHYESKENKKQA